MTRFEKARIISARALQISMGAPILIKTQLGSPMRIAEEEFLKGTTWTKLLKPWFFLIKWLSPIAIVLIILQEGGIIDINLIVNYCHFGCKN